VHNGRARPENIDNDGLVGAYFDGQKTRQERDIE